jgi:anti-sigma regulatory factor (Ser/Thr protein kinase)
MVQTPRLGEAALSAVQAEMACAMHRSELIARWPVPEPHGVVVAFECSRHMIDGLLSTRDARRVGEMRRIGLAWLRYWGLAELIDTALILISELVTNALKHGKGEEIGFSISYRYGQVRFEVMDGSPGTPVIRSTGPDEESGRGMLLVSALADSWGTSEDGTRTWCALRGHSTPAAITPQRTPGRHPPLPPP